jgi:hypothetical protein
LNGGLTRAPIAAEPLSEAPIFVMNAPNVLRWHDNPNLKIQVRVRQPETVHDVWNSCLSAWFARAPKSPKEAALKTKLKGVAAG